MPVVLRVIGTFNAAIWLGSAFFFTFGIAPGIFSAEMKEGLFAPTNVSTSDYYLGIIAQQLIKRYFALNLICGLIALAHFFAEMVYSARPFRRLTFGLIILILGLGLVSQKIFAPKIKEVHQLKYRGATEAHRANAAKQLSRLHAVSATGNLIGLIGLVIYTWRATNPSDQKRFVSTHKFRG